DADRQEQGSQETVDCKRNRRALHRISPESVAIRDPPGSRRIVILHVSNNRICDLSHARWGFTSLGQTEPRAVSWPTGKGEQGIRESTRFGASSSVRADTKRR